MIDCCGRKTTGKRVLLLRLPCKYRKFTTNWKIFVVSVHTVFGSFSKISFTVTVTIINIRNLGLYRHQSIIRSLGRSTSVVSPDLFGIRRIQLNVISQ